MAVMERDRTEERIDELSARVDRGFEQVDKRFEKIDERFEAVTAEFVAVRKETKEGFDKLNRTLIWFAAILIVTLVANGYAN